MIVHTIEQAKESKLFEHIIISTDSDKIVEIAVDNGAEVFFKRNKEMASDTAGKLDVIKDAFRRSEKHFNQIFEYLIDLDATAPLRNTNDILESFKQFKDADNDNLITAMPSRRSPYFNLVELNAEGNVMLSKRLQSTIARRQDAPKSFDMNASIYIWKREALLNNDSLFLNKTGLFIMPEDRSIDVDSELDFKIVEWLMKEKNAKK